jgi:hypothetical protein
MVATAEKVLGVNLAVLKKCRRGPEEGDIFVMLPPIMTNRLPWRHGYLETVCHQELSAQDRLHQHCFKDIRGEYFDEFSNELERPVELVGVWGLGSYRTIDDEVSEALGIPVSDK